MCFQRLVVVLSLLFIPLGNTLADIRSCPEGQYLVRSHWRSGYYRSDGSRVSSAQVSAYCKNYRIQKPLEIHFYDVKWSTWNIFRKRKYKNFSEKEKKQIREALNKIPRILTNIGKITFYRKDQGEEPTNPADVYPKSKRIILYDSIVRYDIERIITHELAHILYENLSNKEVISYATVAQWEGENFEKALETASKRKIFVASDGSDSPSEDFSNNIEYYLFEEKTLKRKNPKIYEWVKKFMGGTEK